MPKKPRNKCLVCGKECKRVKAVYCGNRCFQEDRYRQHIKQWQLGQVSGVNQDGSVSAFIRRYLIEKSGHQCTRCGWAEINPTTGKIPIQIHHIDGDWSNNAEENLTLLCPNCHSLTPNYGSLNTGRGRSFRMDNYEPSHQRPQEKVVRLYCAHCKQSFERSWNNVQTKLRYGQRDFYCSSSCAAKEFGGGRPKNRD